MDTLLGHYTTQRGLLGIVQTQSLWATNIRFLNDEHEFQHALNLIKDIIPQSKIKKTDKDYATHIHYLKTVEDRLESLDGYVSEAVYTFSASTKLDDLSQWRGYCKNDDGYCLTLNIENIFERFKNENSEATCHLEKCIYSVTKKKKRLSELLNEYWFKFKCYDTKGERRMVIDQLADELRLLASYFKEPSFTEEEEWRIIIMFPTLPDKDARHNIKFREGSNAPIPYLEIPIELKDITLVTIGPSLNQKLAIRAVKMLFESQLSFLDFDEPILIRSSIPYRPIS